MLSLEIVDFRVTRNHKRSFRDETELIRNSENCRIHSTCKLGPSLARVGYRYGNGLLSVFFANIVCSVGTNLTSIVLFLSFSSASLRMRIVERKSGDIGSYKERKVRSVPIAPD